MDKILGAKTVILAALAAAGTTISTLLGGWDGFMIALIVAMSMDFVTGLAVAAIWKKSGKSETGALESNACFKGLTRKMMILAFVLLAVQIDGITGLGQVTRTAVIIYYIGNEGISILENGALMGIPYPAILKNALELLRKKGDGAE